MADVLTPDQIAEKAMSLLGARIDTIRRLPEHVLAVEQAQAALAHAEQRYGEAHRDAVRAGWSETELKTMGAPAPTRRAPGRPGGQTAAARRAARRAAEPEAPAGQEEQPPGE